MMKGFDKDGFMSYLEQSFSGFENAFLRGVVGNLVDYTLEHCHHSLDQACYFLSDMLPEVEFSEVVVFMDDSMLTAHGREVKREALELMKDPEWKPGFYRDLDSNQDKNSDGFGRLDDLVSAASGLRNSEIAAAMEQMDRVFRNDSEHSNSFESR